MTDAAVLDAAMVGAHQQHRQAHLPRADLSGYARIDLRLDEEGRPYVLEANPNPNLAYGEDFAESAEKAGVSYEALLDRIIRLGLRWEPARTGSPTA
jgi:D-alanine-D-alanine ligase